MNCYILNTRVDIIDKQILLDKIFRLLETDKFGKQLITINPEFILEAQTNKKFQDIINRSWSSVADGYGLLLASKYLDLTKNSKSIFHNFLSGIKIAIWGITRKKDKFNIVTETITGTDLVPKISKLPNVKRIYLLGGFGDTPQTAAKKLKELNTDLEISYSVFETDNIIDKIKSFKPQILFVALNHPEAQIWLDNNLSKLESVHLGVGVGGAFDYISGKVKRAPISWQGYEWLHRLIHQPKRIRRIFNAWIVFSWKVYNNSIKKHD